MTRKYTDEGKRIKKCLIDRDMTAAELAERVGTTPQYINKILHGDRTGAKYLDSIRRTLGMTA